MNEFESLNIKKSLIEKLETMRIKTPTPIQEEAIPAIFNGADIIAQAKTGTGKTLAFLLPVFQMMKKDKKEIQTLIITPTRELAIQVGEEAEKINTDFNILSVYGGKDINAQLHRLKGTVDLIIATPGRLMDHIKRGTINLESINYFIIDELDQILLMGFKDDIEFISKKISTKRQNMFFSATIDSKVKKIAYRYSNKPQEIKIEDGSKFLKNITQYGVDVKEKRKDDLLCEIINRDRPFLAIVFCKTKKRVDFLEKKLYARGYSCNKLHGDVPQAKREKIMKAFKNLEIQILLASDVAARGIDVKGVTHIYNYDAPDSLDAYIHRIGRTARAGHDGVSYLLFNEYDREFKKISSDNLDIEKLHISFESDVHADNILPDKKYDKRVHIKRKVIK